VTKPDGGKQEFQTRIRIDSPSEVDYYRNGGIFADCFAQIGGGDAIVAKWPSHR